MITKLSVNQFMMVALVFLWMTAVASDGFGFLLWVISLVDEDLTFSPRAKWLTIIVGVILLVVGIAFYVSLPEGSLQ